MSRQEINISKEVRENVFSMSFAGHCQNDICMAIGISRPTFYRKLATDVALARCYRAGTHYYYQWVKLKRHEHKALKLKKIRGRHIGLIPFFTKEKTFHEIMMTPYIPRTAIPKNK